MGASNSSKTRVAPVFDELLARDPKGDSWLSRLLSLPELPGRSPPRANPKDLGSLQTWGWGEDEFGLDAPPGLLRWLLDNATVPPQGNQWGSATTKAKREALLVKKDPKTLEEACRLLSAFRGRGTGWYVLEGTSFPDVYLETDKVLVVIEGKRMETAPTLKTTWMDPRPQILRHLDCAFERRRGRAVVGFLIVEGTGEASAIQPPPLWVDAASKTVLPTVLDASLPHRTPSERNAISAAFLGVTTWQRLCQEFQLTWPPSS